MMVWVTIMNRFFESKEWYGICIAINVPALLSIPYVVFVERQHVELFQLIGWLVIALFEVHWINKFIKAR